MMGEDPETFTEENIDRAIAYLFPSGLFEKQARPIMKHPEQIFPKQRAIQWGKDGRPFNFLFYTVDQSYYSLMHEVCGKVLQLETHRSPLSEKTETKDLIGNRWLIKKELEELLVGKLSDQDYVHFIQLLEKLLTLPYRPAEEEFMQTVRKSLTVQSKKQDREQLVFPFHFLDRLEKHNATCTVSGGVGDQRMREPDRKKPGQEGARRKFTWKKRSLRLSQASKEHLCLHACFVVEHVRVH
ncbi:hypothetical protein ACRRTK_023756 [Alexandromys fortis]